MFAFQRYVCLFGPFCVGRNGRRLVRNTCRIAVGTTFLGKCKLPKLHYRIEHNGELQSMCFPLTFYFGRTTSLNWMFPFCVFVEQNKRSAETELTKDSVLCDGEDLQRRDSIEDIRLRSREDVLKSGKP